MKIGYPCSNLSIGCSTARTFRLASTSPERAAATIHANLDCLQMALEWNAAHDIRFLRISSSTIPFASHPVMTFAWQREFSGQLAEIGAFIRAHGMRVNTHPGQFVLLNSPGNDVVANSVAELVSHAELLDLMGLDHTATIQIHTGGVDGDKPAAIDAFCQRYIELPEIVRRRLVIENDERSYALADNLVIHERTGIPLLFDVFHHGPLNEGESLPEAFDRFTPTWDGHGTPMLDYSTQHPDRQPGAHAQAIDLEDFRAVVDQLGDRDVDIMLEIKDKEHSAIAALSLLVRSGRLSAPDDSTHVR